VDTVLFDAPAAGEKQYAGVGRQFLANLGDLPAAKVNPGRIVVGKIFHGKKP
jgi:hypothetical protein